LKRRHATRLADLDDHRQFGDGDEDEERDEQERHCARGYAAEVKRG
jgi:hypothetical protein